MGLVDCNNFFVSCERVFRPKLIGKPVIVLSSNDGCVVARSNEAKALGIPMGVPFFQIADLVKREHVQVASGNLELYGDLSRRVMMLVEQCFPTVEVYSIDECFFRLSSGEHGLNRAQQLHKEIFKGVGIPVSIGLAPSRTLAKVAVSFAKRVPGYQGVAEIASETQREKALALTPIRQVWGIGRHMSKKLQLMGCRTALEFSQLRPEWVQKQFTIGGWRTQQELLGIEAIPFEQKAPRQSASRSRSFSQPITCRTDMLSVLLSFSEAALAMVRAEGLVATRLSIFMTANRFRPQPPQEDQYAEILFEEPISRVSHIVGAVEHLLDKIFCHGGCYHRAGVILRGLIPVHGYTSLFYPIPSEHQELYRTMDHLQQKYGRETIRLAAVQPGLIDRLVRQSQRSQRASTRLSEVLVVS